LPADQLENPPPGIGYLEPVEELRGRISLVVMLAFGLDNWGQGLLSFLWKGDEWTTISL
jgi:hypothetical protein